VSGHASQLAALVRAVLASEPSVGATRAVCIDGPAASGKTTLAEAAEAALCRRGCRTTTLHMDDFYAGWSGLRPDLEPRVRNQVFEPLSRGGRACWQRYDWYGQRFAEWYDLDPPDVLILEGCGSGALSYAAHRSLLVWLEAPLGVRMRRWVDRDGPGVLLHRRQWMDAEADHFALNSTRDNADLRLESR
jgi:uridine kinase